VAPPAATTLVLGGARSGKSTFAERTVRETGLARVYVATAPPPDPSDPDMLARVERHRADRGEGWLLVEEQVDLVDVLARHAAPTSALLVDCLTLWLSNLMERGLDVDAETARLAEALGICAGPVVLVSNEVGMGVHPPTPLGREFRDHQGRVNQRVAEACDAVRLVVAGIPVPVKG
jgi:adenosylcobinamide kinase / adenosylcobinamide-phosphate guanylyltransferase